MPKSNPKLPIEVEEILEKHSFDVMKLAGVVYRRKYHLDNLEIVDKKALAALNKAYGEKFLGLVGEDEDESYYYAGRKSVYKDNAIVQRNLVRKKLRAAINKQFLGGE